MSTASRPAQARSTIGALLAAALVIAPVAAAAQGSKLYRVGIVLNPTAEARLYLDTFRQTMRDLGYVEGGNVTLDIREPDADLTRVPSLMDELLALKPDVLVAWESVAQVVRTKTTSVPIVLTGSIDPVRAGLARDPTTTGMNMTGIAQLNDQLAVATCS